MSYSGILRKKNVVASDAGEARQVDLLVFGYACKVFRDDVKALEIDQGKHLIDWMGDSSLKIDRYDVRGALFELASYEPPPGGYGNRLDYLSAEEQRAEQLCEEERYLYLYNNEEEHILQQEEELKRLKQESCGTVYNQVGFLYGTEAGAGDVANMQQGPQYEGNMNSPISEESEQPFQLPKHLEVPASLQLPETMKQHAIIEKTARFIASQGVQMEILLKAKQSNNVQFEFLNQNSILNQYYKFIVNAIKSGTYPAEELKDLNVNLNVDAVTNETTNSDANNVSIPKPVIAVPTIKYKPSANCAYTQLISKIKGVPLPQVLQECDNASNTSSPASVNSNSDRFTPVLLVGQYNGNTFITADEDNSNSNSQMTKALDEESKVEILKNSSALALAQNYSSDSEDDDEISDAKKSPQVPSPVLNFPIPGENLKNIIDKTATYVVKNGRQFEETLRTKSEERFTFLLPDNEHYPYYMYKITGDPDAASKEQKTRKAAAVAAALLSKKGLKKDKTISPVSFSIKPKDDLSTTALPPALPQEASDDDDEKIKTAGKIQSSLRTVPESVQKAIQLVESQLMAKNAQLAVLTGKGAAAVKAAASSTATRSRFDVADTNASKTHAKTPKSNSERNALYEQQQQNRQKELRKAEEKVKDKLAQRAREKLCGLLTKEKQLQLERKRKAMAFLNQIKESSSKDSPSVLKEVTGGKTIEANENDSGDSDASVHSIPITSYGPECRTDDEEESSFACAISFPMQMGYTISEAVSQQPLVQSISKKLENDTEKQCKATSATVLLSDDDDVQVISEHKLIRTPTEKRSFTTASRRLSRSPHRKHRPKHTRSRSRSRSRSRLRSRSRSRSQSSLSTSSSFTIKDTSKDLRHANSSKLRSHKSAKSKKSSKSSRRHRHRTERSKKSKKSSSRQCRSRSRSRYSRSYSRDSVISGSNKRRLDKESNYPTSPRKREKSRRDNR